MGGGECQPLSFPLGMSLLMIKKYRYYLTEKKYFVNYMFWMTLGHVKKRLRSAMVKDKSMTKTEKGREYRKKQKWTSNVSCRPLRAMCCTVTAVAFASNEFRSSGQNATAHQMSYVRSLNNPKHIWWWYLDRMQFLCLWQGMGKKLLVLTCG